MSLLTFGGKSLLKYRKLVECSMCYLNWKRYQLAATKFSPGQRLWGKHISHYRNENQSLKGTQD
jgi:hypothetical protein